MSSIFLSKPKLLGAVLALLCLAAPGRADLIGYDGFDYRGASLNGVAGGSFWGYQNISPAGHKAGMSDWDDAPGFGSVSAPSGGKLYTADSGVIREYSGPSGPDETNSAVNDTNEAKKVYYRVTITLGTGATWGGVSSFDFGTERLFFGLFPDGTGKFSIYDQNSFTRLALSTVNVNVGQTYTLVAKLDFAADTVALFADPDLTQSEAANPPIATAAYSGTQWSTALRLGSGGNGQVSWDDLAVATTWESLRTYEVTNLNDGGAGSLRVLMSLARTTGGRVTFAPALRSVYAVSLTNHLLRFKRETPGLLEMDIPITGLPAGVTLAEIDFRPSTGELYALGKRSGEGGTARTNELWLYQLNVTTAAATLVGSGPFSSTLGENAVLGFDFDPARDLIRVTSDAGGNVLLNPNNGIISAVQSPLVFTDGTLFGAKVRQTAYSDNTVGTTGTTLYGFHSMFFFLDSRAEFVRIGGDGPFPDPANGQVRRIHGFIEGVSYTTGFDIGDDGLALVSGLAPDYQPANSLSTLYEMDLKSGKLTSQGLIGNGIGYISGIAMSPSRITLTSGPITLPGGNAFVVDGPSTAPGITLAGRRAQNLVAATSGAAVAFRHLNFTESRENQGSAIIYGSVAAGEPTGLLALERCALFGNHATSRGPALLISHGNARLTQCTFANNTSGDGGAGAIYQLDGAASNHWGKIILTHCTVTRNHTESASSIRPPQAVVLPFANVMLEGCLIAGNTNGGGSSPDLLLTGNILQPAVVDHSLIGDGTGTGVVHAANGNRAGTTAIPLAPRLALLENYGGPTRTAPPFPGSPAIGLATATVLTSDQRAFPMVGVPDAGAAEFQGKTDLARWWKTDWDGDGVPFGTEFALSGNPLLAGPSPVSIIGNAIGEPVIYTSYNNRFALPWTRWSLSRSSTPGQPWETIFTYHGPTGVSTSDPGVEVLFTTNIFTSWQITDLLPNPPRNFYRFTAELVP